MKIELARPLGYASIGTENGPARTLGGLAVPYNVVANASSGPVKFLPGSLPTDGPAPKLLRDHDVRCPIGLVTARTDTPEGMRFEARVSETEYGDEALVLAADRVLDMVSVGVEPTAFHWEGNVMVVEAGEWLELSLLPFGAFPQARVDHVAAPTEMPTDTAPEPAPENTPADTPDNPAQAADTPSDGETEELPEEEIMEDTIKSSAPTDIVPAGQLRIAASAAPKITAADWIAGSIKKTLPSTALETIYATAGLEVPADIPGLVPDLLIRPLYDSLLAIRPIVSALGTYGMPGGNESFYRRYVDQHVDVAELPFDGTDFTTASFKVERLQVDKKYFGGQVTVSEAAQLFSDTMLLGLIMNDLAKVYGRATEAYAASVIVNGANTATSTISDLTDGDEVVSKLFLAAAEMRGVASYLPTHLICSTSAWAKLGAAKNGAGNFVFPYMNPFNAAGQFAGPTVTNGNPLGLQLVVSGDLSNDDSFLLYNEGVELYEDQRGALSWINPSNANTILSFRGLFAGCVIDADRVLKVA